MEGTSSLKENRQDDKKVVIVGFGYIGCTIGAVLANRGFNVTGIETDSRILEAVSAGNSPFNEPGLGELIADGVAENRVNVTLDPAVIRDARIVIISVGTPLSENGEADLSQIEAACRAIQPYLTEDHLVLFKSTLPPGTTRHITETVLRADHAVSVAFSPERIAEGRAVQELTSIPIVVGGLDQQSTDLAAEFWQDALDVEVIKVSSCEAAELVKLADNLWIDLNIALANELAKLGDSSSFYVDILEVINAANSLPKGTHNVNILTPSMGVGGYCLTKDPWFVAGAAKKLGLDLLTPVTSRTANDSMPKYCATRIRGFFDQRKIDPADSKICILGLAFKNNTGDCRFTPVIDAIEALRSLNFGEMVISDPWVDDQTAEHLGVTLTSDIEEAIKDSTCVGFFTGHDEFKTITPDYLDQQMKSPGLVFDGRMFFSRAFINDLDASGISYLGVGR